MEKNKFKLRSICLFLCMMSVLLVACSSDMPATTKQCASSTIASNPAVSIPSGNPTDPAGPIPSSNSYPLVYVADNQAYIIGAVHDGIYYSVQDLIIGKEWQEGVAWSDQKETVVWPQLDTSFDLVLYNWDSELLVHVTDIIVGHHSMGERRLKLETSTEIPTGRIYVGTYRGLDVIDTEAQYIQSSQEQSFRIKTDLDGDGNMDFVQGQYDEGPEDLPVGHNYLPVTVERNGKTYCIEDCLMYSEDYDHRIIPADLDQDGEMELIFLNPQKQGSKLHVFVYRFFEDRYLLFDTPIAPARPENTNLEFWIGQDVADVDWSEYDEQPLFGGMRYLGKGYHYVIDESGYQHLPEKYVEYTVGHFPDEADRGAYVTSIWITDPEITVHGITIHSSKEEFIRVFTQLGYKVGYDADERLRAFLNNISFFFEEGDHIHIYADVTNRTGIEY